MIIKSCANDMQFQFPIIKNKSSLQQNEICAGFIIYNTNEDHILLVQGKTSKKWGPPKGHKESYDTNTIETAIREVYQETGISITADKKFKSIRAGKVKLYIIKLDFNPIINISDTNEINNCEWKNIDNLYYLFNQGKTHNFNSPLRYLLKHKSI